MVRFVILMNAVAAVRSPLLGAGEWEGMKAKTSNLNEDLGRIQHIFRLVRRCRLSFFFFFSFFFLFFPSFFPPFSFLSFLYLAFPSFLCSSHSRAVLLRSDKTGTLTENVMKFRATCVGGELFMASDGSMHQQIASGDKSVSSTALLNEVCVRQVPLFLVALCSLALAALRCTKVLECLTLNQASVPEKDTKTGLLRYPTPSPDENALLEFAVANDYVFLARESKCAPGNACCAHLFSSHR